MSLKPKTSLNHLSSSPVRGQLEPYDASSPEGWRWLQTTDTVDQFKVLLPPETARMYAEILRQERLELSQKAQVNWGRVLEIRHLKDRMIRKTQRLSNAREVRRIGQEQFKFQSLVAPVDFRLKEMERWLRINHIGGPAAIVPSTSRSAPVTKVYQATTSHSALRHRSSTATCARCASRAVHVHASGSSSKAISSRTSTHRPSSRTSRLAEELHIHDEVEEQLLEEPEERPERPTSAVGYFPRTSTPPNMLRDTDSPDPLPVKIREHIAISPPGSQESVVLPTLTRRRSSLKRRGSVEAGKTVSWADDKPWMEHVSKYSVLAQEAFESGNHWDEARNVYEEQLSNLDNLHRQVEEGMVRLRLEMQQLQKVDESIIVQKATLQRSFSEMEQTQAVFLAKVNQVLDEAQSSPKPEPQAAGPSMPETIKEESVIVSETQEE